MQKRERSSRLHNCYTFDFYNRNRRQNEAGFNRGQDLTDEERQEIIQSTLEEGWITEEEAIEGRKELEERNGFSRRDHHDQGIDKNTSEFDRVIESKTERCRKDKDLSSLSHKRI